ncbi:MAG TPA: biotin/lipoyl-containing protein, partial [Acidimicrobiales bacterium]|nr:biotin/lipoyl-containing protein [Acidimicrobiales bacterium]
MPQLGETVTEGTITRWAKKVGDKVDIDEILFEVSTDKVDSEVPSSAGGYLAEILVPEGETVDVGTKLAVISEQAVTDGAAPAAEAAAAAPPPAPAPVPEPAPEPAAEVPAPAPPAPPAAAPTGPAAPVAPAPPVAAASPAPAPEAAESLVL